MTTHKNGPRLLQDLKRMAFLQQRRQFMQLMAATGVTTLVGCGSNQAGRGSDASNGNVTSGNGNTTTGNATSTVDDSNTTTQCADIPEETQGPYPGDGSNGPNALTMSGIVRSDITSSFGSYSGTATGVPLTLKMRIVTVSGSCVAAAGKAVYVWHCDVSGNYSLYGAANQNYLRGVQETDADGYVTFQTIWPACYSGRWPHIHFEVYPSIASATSANNKTNTSQLAMPKDICTAVFATSAYASSVSAFAQTSLATDMVFSDGATLETPSVTGSVDAGYNMLIQVGV